jgi:hypothetical protein
MLEWNGRFGHVPKLLFLLYFIMVFLEITLSNTQLITFFYFQSFEHIYIYIYIYICLSQSFFLYRSLTNVLLESAPPLLIDTASPVSPPARLPLIIQCVFFYFQSSVHGFLFFSFSEYGRFQFMDWICWVNVVDFD